jgi:hypothetical protein
MPRSPRRRIPLASVIGELTVLRTRLGFAKTSADLTPATGARTTRFCRTQLPSPNHSTGHLRPAEVLAEALSAVRLHAVDRSRKTALRTCLRARRCRVHRFPSQRFVTIAIRPSFKGMRCGSYGGDLGETGRGIFLRRGLDGGNQIDLVEEISALAQRAGASNRTAFMIWLGWITSSDQRSNQCSEQSPC